MHNNTPDRGSLRARCSSLFAIVAATAMLACTACATAHDEIEHQAIHDDGLPAHLTRHVSEHFVLVTHANEDLAQARLELLEATYTRFYDSFQEAGFDPKPSRQRLIAVLFDEHDAYVEYAVEADRIDMSWSNGYYSARTNRVALVVAREDQVSTVTRADRRGEVLPYGESKSQNDDAAANDEASSEVQEHAASRIVVSMKPISVASTAHEAAHQLAFNSGLQKRGVMYPLWASEGLATCFEPQAVDEDYGPEHVNVNRRRDLVESMDANAIMPLDEFVSLTRLPTNDSRAVTRLYAQGWSLFHYLFENHPEALNAYLKSLAELRPGRRTQATMRAEFIAAFGPIDRIEAKWRQSLADHRVAHFAQRERETVAWDETSPQR